MPHVQLRTLAEGEQALLPAKLRPRSLSVRVWERSRIASELSQGRSPAQVADRVGYHLTVVYHWLHRFNESGFATFEVAPNPRGRAATIGSAKTRALLRATTGRLQDLGLPFTDWPVAKLHQYCDQRGLLPPCTDEWVRRLRRREGLTYQRTRTWKQSNAPFFEERMGGYCRPYNKIIWH